MICLLLILLAAAGTLCQSATQQPVEFVEPSTSEPVPDQIDDLIHKILTTEVPEEAYQELFERVGLAGAQGLRNHAEDTIAIQAAWETLKRLAIPENGPLERRRPRKQLLSFLEFLKRRTEISLPDGWSEAMLDSFVDGGIDRSTGKRYRYSCVGEPRKDPYHKVGLEDAMGPRDLTLARIGDRVQLKIGNESLWIRDEVLMRYAEDGRITRSYSALLTATRCYVVSHHRDGYAFRLFCVDRQQGEILWQRDVLRTPFIPLAGFIIPNSAKVFITEHGDQIVLFSCDWHTGTVEALSREDGKRRFLFSTAY